MFFRSLPLCKTIFAGVVIPLQLLFSGYLILIPTLQSWNSWGTYICPMSYYLAGVMRNEFENNANALNSNSNDDSIVGSDDNVTVSYNNLQGQYDYHVTLHEAVLVLIAMGFCYKLIWFLTLRLHALSRQRALRRKVIGFRRKARRFVSGVLRMSESFSSATTGGRRDDDADGVEVQ